MCMLANTGVYLAHSPALHSELCTRCLVELAILCCYIMYYIHTHECLTMLVEDVKSTVG